MGGLFPRCPPHAQGWPQPTLPAAAAAAAAPLSPIKDVTLRRLGENGRPRGWRRKRRISEHINANLKTQNHTYDGLTRRASTEVQCRLCIIRRDIQRNPGRTIMMVVAWTRSLSVKSSFEWKERLKTKFQPFEVELFACRNRIELESSDLSITSRYKCFPPR